MSKKSVDAEDINQERVDECPHCRQWMDIHDAVVADSDKLYAVLRQALEALESDPVSHAGLVNRKQAITALRQALEEKREPVFWSVATGWVYDNDISQDHVDETAKQELEPVVNIVTGLRLKEPEDVSCKTHPDAPHGFDRNMSHTLDRYVCECEYWEPADNETNAVKGLYKDDNDTGR
jgi:hypothetical protein